MAVFGWCGCRNGCLDLDIDGDVPEAAEVRHGAVVPCPECEGLAPGVDSGVDSGAGDGGGPMGRSAGPALSATWE